MKDKRTITDIVDFSGGLVTNIPIISLEPKYTPDSMNVYNEGVSLKKREGISKVNSAAVATGSACNIVYNYVKNASEQWLVTSFGSNLYKMDISGTAWDGTFDIINADNSNGTAFSDSIFHMATYSGVLLITNEARDKPQRMLSTDSSHFDMDYNGVGTVPPAKYIRVWRDHVWLLNIGAGGALTEDCDTISGWSDNDTGTGASTQTTYDSKETFKFITPANNDVAKRTQDIGDVTDNFSLEIKSYPTLLGTTAQGYAQVDVCNGIIKLQTRWSDEGLTIYDGTSWNEVGVNVVSESVWATWKFVVTGSVASTAVVDIYKDGSLIALQHPCKYASAATDGQVDLSVVRGSAGVAAEWYTDYIYINSTIAKDDYFSDGGFEAWDDASTPTSPNNKALPSLPYVWFKCEDSAGNTTVTNDGSEGTNGTLYAGVTTTYTTAVSDPSGKIDKSFSFSSASQHNIQLGASTLTAITADTVGTFCFWSFMDATGKTLISFGNSTEDSQVGFRHQSGYWEMQGQQQGGASLRVRSTVAVGSGAWSFIAFTQDGSKLRVYIDGDSSGTSVVAGTANNFWLASIGTIDLNAIGFAVQYNGGSISAPYDGKIDDIRYYETALAPREIKSIYGEGVGSGVAATSREGTTIKYGTYSYKLTNASSYGMIYQTLSSGSELGGVSSIVGGWFHVTNNKPYKFIIEVDGTESSSSTFVGNGAWQYQTYNFTPSSNAGSVTIQMVLASAGTMITDGVSVITTSLGLTQDNEDRVQRSALGEYKDWTGTDSGTEDLVTEGDIGITGSFILDDRMYVTKKYSIHKFTYTASVPLVDIKQIRSGVGTNSPRSIQNIILPKEGEVIIFLGTDRKLYLFDGANTQVISDSVQLNNGITNIYLNNINSQALDKVFAVLHADKRWYELFIPIGNATVPNFSIIYDYANNAFWPFSNRNFKAGTASDDGSGQRRVYVGGASNGFVYLTNSTNSDDGANINAYWISPKIGDSTTLSRIDEINIYTESVDATPVFQWRDDFSSEFTTKTLSSSVYKTNYNPGLTDNYIQYKFSDDSTNEEFTLWAIRTLFKIIGHGA